MAKFKEETDTKSCCRCYWDCKLVKPLWTSAQRSLRKLKENRSDESDLPLLGMHAKDTSYSTNTCSTMFFAFLFTIARTWKQMKCPSINERINENVVHSYGRILFGYNKNEVINSGR